MLSGGQEMHALFCCQQAVEKALKAVIIARTGKMAPRTHNLPRLAELADVALDELQLDLLANLSTLYNYTRYPDELEEASVDSARKEIREIFRLTEETVQWLLSLLR